MGLVGEGALVKTVLLQTKAQARQRKVVLIILEANSGVVDMSIVIPVRGSTSTVEIFNDELPDVSTDVINLLRAELPPVHMVRIRGGLPQPGPRRTVSRSFTGATRL